jgi:hypothetical protein
MHKGVALKTHKISLENAMKQKNGPPQKTKEPHHQKQQQATHEWPLFDRI